MKRIFTFVLFLTMLLGLSFHSKAEDGQPSVTIHCENPERLDSRGESADGLDWIETTVSTTENAVVIYNNKTQVLDENGIFQLDAAAGAKVTVTDSKTTEIAGMSPKSGSTVKSFNQVDLILPALENLENIFSPVESILKNTVVTFNDNDVATVEEIGEMTMNTQEQLVMTIIFNKSLTEDGRYYIKVPQGAFAEAAWDDAADSYVTVPGGFITAAQNFNLKVDSSAKSALEDYVLSPAAGSLVGEIASVNLAFPQLAPNSLSAWEFPNATFTNGEKTVEAIVILDWMNEDCTAFNITPVNEDEEPSPITEIGKWTLKVEAGSFTTEGDSNPEITAEFTVTDAPIYTLSPANGAKTDNLSKISITFPGVETVEYNDLPISLTGPDSNSANSTDVSGTGNTFTVNFRNPSAAGEYTVNFPAGAFLLDGEESVETVASYIFQNSWELNPVPGTEVESLDVITISFPNATEVEFVGETYSFLLTNGYSYAAPGMNCEKDASADVPTF